MTTINGARFYMTDGQPDPQDQPHLPAIDLDTATIREIGLQLRAEIEQIDEGHEYFSLSSDVSYSKAGRADEPIGRYRWIACYAVTGTSEGHYIHVDRIYQTEPAAAGWTHEQLFLGKTFGGYDCACRVAAYIGRRLGA